MHPRPGDHRRPGSRSGRGRRRPRHGTGGSHTPGPPHPPRRPPKKEGRRGSDSVNVNYEELAQKRVAEIAERAGEEPPPVSPRRSHRTSDKGVGLVLPIVVGLTLLLVCGGGAYYAYSLYQQRLGDGEADPTRADASASANAAAAPLDADGNEPIRVLEGPNQLIEYAGSQKPLDTLESLRATGSLERGDRRYLLTVYAHKSGFYRVELAEPAGQSVYGFNGESYWEARIEDDSVVSVRPFSSEGQEIILVLGRLHMPAILSAARRRGTRAEASLIGPGEFDGQSAYILEIASPALGEIRAYFSQRTHGVIGESILHGGQNRRMIFGDHRMRDGYQLAFEVEHYIDNTQREHIYFNRIEPNDTFDTSLFDPPQS